MRYLLKRLRRLVIVLAAVTFVTFLLVNVLPGDVAYDIAGYRDAGVPKPGADGRMRLLEIGNIDRGAKLPPNKTILKVQVFADLDRESLQELLNNR